MVAVVIPCYRVRDTLPDVLRAIGPEVGRIYVVDDSCPEGSGKMIQESNRDPRVEVLFHEKNRGVGGAVKTGYRRALQEGAAIVVKIDGDGQMDPTLIPGLIAPILNHQADYVKGNRFFDLAYLKQMPGIRKFGNAILSFVNKMVTGYWDIMDPTNGFTAITAEVLNHLPPDKTADGFFFEQDMLYRLSILRAVVLDFPVRARYVNEKSNLKIRKVLLSFPLKHMTRLCKRIFYSYFQKDFNIGSLELIMAFLFTTFGLIFGSLHWFKSVTTLHPATAGTVILAGLPVILGFQSFLAFLHYDLMHIPKKPLSHMHSKTVSS